MRVAFLALAPAVVALAIASCSTEGDALLRIARDSGVDTALPDTRVVPDTRVITCGPTDACVVANGDQCCAYLLSYICVEAGTCEGGPIPCDQPAHCGPGRRCCGQPAAFLINTFCSTEPCPQFEMCARDDECPAGKTCTTAANGFSSCN
jgi:hypothetical protein